MGGGGGKRQTGNGEEEKEEKASGKFIFSFSSSLSFRTETWEMGWRRRRRGAEAAAVLHSGVGGLLAEQLCSSPRPHSSTPSLLGLDHYVVSVVPRLVYG